VVHEFGSDRSEALHDSLGVLRSKPIDKTVLSAVDEFYSPDGGEFVAMANEGQFDVGKFHVSPTLGASGKLAAVPYYANVLLLAWRKGTDVASTDQATKWRRGKSEKKWDQEIGSVANWQSVASAVKCVQAGSLNRSSGQWPFEVGAWSDETMACILLDALISGSRGPATQRPDGDEWFSLPDSAKGEAVLGSLENLAKMKPPALDHAKEELNSIGFLFRNSRHAAAYSGTTPTSEKGERSPSEELVPSAAVYVCWYSQLRELVEAHPEIARELCVAALPGGGVRGDWFMGIVDGSVSVKLGRDVLERLCGEEEEHKRFVRGVGLPVREKYVCADFLAWPLSKLRVGRIMEIHKQALARSSIPLYRHIRAVLGIMGRQIAFAQERDIKEVVDDCMSRIPNVVTFARQMSPSGAHVGSSRAPQECPAERGVGPFEDAT
jgi:hypothetical protein